MKVHCPQKKICYHLDFSKHITVTVVQNKSTPLNTTTIHEKKGPINFEMRLVKRYIGKIMGRSSWKDFMKCESRSQISGPDPDEFSPGFHFGWYFSLHVLLETTLRNLQGQGLDEQLCATGVIE